MPTSLDMHCGCRGRRPAIVCGSINLAPDTLVVVAKPSAMVRWHGAGDPIE